ncbi:TPA: ornithine cyclodeaminase [Pseudomonas aeruginosa]|uniref:ornithine cyclodeaminase family protein n=1 Tax=Pseudomonas TaxID=286 RepID=UPI000CD4514B|nr:MULTISPECIES: ornithine cyclodeaminase [Pseudomonas]MBH9519098.1 ornithine cyclodeaminase [Pseudomonas aeruginosa]MBI8577255.1 ornithine cyclodeaminase [Pseudomonas aeruginosa]MBI8804370.1 ornithine cyclodeaminase [Pseudomonas aeruginosa]MCU9208623.1 ornithine cyclodeaminase [Pseudomonas aeruginosa]MDA3374370.1 ornithine cyclodeaminase [Pseudomonas aeruginosa]
MQVISANEISSVMNWSGVLDSLRQAHLGTRPAGESLFIGDTSYSLFSRGVVLPGLGAGIKVCSIYPANNSATPPLPTEQAVFLVIDENSKSIVAALDGPEITRWKTAADSALAAQKLSREDSSVLLVLGAGPIAQALTDAYLHIRPSIDEVLLWNRTASKLSEAYETLELRGISVSIVSDLDAAISKADIITSATSSSTPLVRGELVRPGTHVDLVGGFRVDMREADDNVVKEARIFVDDRSTSACSGDIQVPLQNGVITEDQIEGDLFDLCQHTSFSRTASDKTVYKNAGGAHLDLIVSQYVIGRLKA